MESKKKSTGKFTTPGEIIDTNENQTLECIEQRRISNNYQPPQSMTINHDQLNNYYDSSSQFNLESTIEGKLQQTKELINDAIKTVNLGHSKSVKYQPVKDQPRRVQKKHGDDKSPNIKRIDYNKLERIRENIPSPISDVTPSYFPRKSPEKVERTSPIRNEYEALILESQEKDKNQMGSLKKNSSKKRKKSRNDRKKSLTRNKPREVSKFKESPQIKGYCYHFLVL